MPVRRGTLRDDDDDAASGGVFHTQRSDTPDDAIVVDLRDDKESLNWLQYGPEDSRERFSDWTDEKAQQRLSTVREKLRDVRSGASDAENE